MLQTFMAHLFLIRLRLIFKKNSPPSPQLKLDSWWLRLSQMKLDLSRMAWLRSTVISSETMQPTVHIASTVEIDITDPPQKCLGAKRRSNTQNVVVMQNVVVVIG